MVETIGFLAGIMLPLFDIPLIAHIVRRRSSADISIVWALGIWVCSLLMAPSAFIAKNPVAIGFNVVNCIMLTIVVFVVIKYQKGKP